MLQPIAILNTRLRFCRSARTRGRPRQSTVLSATASHTPTESLKLMHSVLSKRESAYLAHSSDVIPSISNAVRPAARSKAGGDTPSRELAAAAELPAFA